MSSFRHQGGAGCWDGWRFHRQVPSILHNPKSQFRTEGMVSLLQITSPASVGNENLCLLAATPLSSVVMHSD